MGMKEHARELHALRAGTVKFDRVARVLTPLLAARAAWFLRRWRQTLLNEADLVQEMLLAVWRAVDVWDPELSNDLPRWVDTQVGRVCELELARAAGWPDKRRAPVLRQVGVEDVTALVGGYEPTLEVEVDRRSRLLRITSRLAPDDQAVFTVVVANGVAAAEAADVLYADPGVRLDRCWDSPRHARRDVKEAVKRIEAVAEYENTMAMKGAMH